MYRCSSAVHAAYRILNGEAAAGVVVAPPRGEDCARVPAGLCAKQHLLQVSITDALLLFDERVGGQVADVERTEVFEEVLERHPVCSYQCIALYSAQLY